jgi:cysteine desulfurase
VAARHGAVFHTDAVQAFGRLPEDALVADLVSVSGHKIGAPAGVGALVRRAEVSVPPLVKGGGQERGSRGGTENVAAIAGFAAALEAPVADPRAWVETAAARDEFEKALAARFPEARIFGAGAERLPNTSLFSVGAPPAEIALIGLDLAGVAVSSGAACSSGKVTVSHVLLAMGVEEEVAKTAIRASAGPEGAAADFERFLVALENVVVRRG